MITPDFIRLMARYNTWQNRSLVSAADTLDEAARQQDRGAFFGSIAGTFSHLLWGDSMWMSRFDGFDKPGISIADSARFAPDWAGFKARRAALDARILDWARRVGDAWIAGETRWLSAAAGREIIKPTALLCVHFFNHQTHHRGQIHAMLTAAGATPDDTDLFLMPEV